MNNKLMNVLTWFFIVGANIVCWSFLIIMYQEYKALIIITVVCGFIVMRTITLLFDLLFQTKQLEKK